MLKLREAHKITQALAGAMLVPVERQGSIALLPSQLGIVERERDVWTYKEAKYIRGHIATFSGLDLSQLERKSQRGRDVEIRPEVIDGFSLYLQRTESNRPVLYLAPPGFKFEGRYGD